MNDNTLGTLGFSDVARRFGKQIFLSVDMPSEFVSTGLGATLLVDMEKGIVGALKEMEART